MTKARKVKAFAAISTLALSAVICMESTTAQATVIGFDLIATSATGPSGSGFLGYDDVTKTFSVEKFAFDDPLGAFDEVVSITPTDIQLGWLISDPANGPDPTQIVVDFKVDRSLLLSRTIGGTYADTNPTDRIDVSGTWRLEKRSVPEPGSLALAGVVLLALGLAQYRRRKTA